MKAFLAIATLTLLTSCLSEVRIPADERVDHFKTHWEIEPSDIKKEVLNDDGSTSLFLKKAYAEGIEDGAKAGLSKAEKGGLSALLTGLTVLGATLIRRWKLSKAAPV